MSNTAKQRSLFEKRHALRTEHAKFQFVAAQSSSQIEAFRDLEFKLENKLIEARAKRAHQDGMAPSADTNAVVRTIQSIVDDVRELRLEQLAIYMPAQKAERALDAECKAVEAEIEAQTKKMEEGAPRLILAYCEAFEAGRATATALGAEVLATLRQAHRDGEFNG